MHELQNIDFSQHLRDAATQLGFHCDEVELIAGAKRTEPWLRIAHPNGPFLYRDGILCFESRLRPQRPGRKINQQAEAICSSRGALRAVLAKRNLPVWQGWNADEAHLQTVLTHLSSMTGHVRLMGDDANGLRGKPLGVENYRSDLIATIREAALAMIGTQGLVSLEMIPPGQHLYLFYADGEIQAAQLRAPNHVVGDGRKTVYQLIVARNAQAMRDQVIVLGPGVMRALSRQDLTLSSVPSAGAAVLLGRVHDGGTGFVAYGLRGTLDPGLEDLALAAAAAIDGFHYGAIELFIPDGAPLSLGAGVHIRNVIPYADPVVFVQPETGGGTDLSAALLATLARDDIRAMTSWPAYAPSSLDEADPGLTGMDAESRAMAAQLARAGIPYKVSAFRRPPEDEFQQEITFEIGGRQYGVLNGALRIRLEDGKRCHINAGAGRITNSKALTKSHLQGSRVWPPVGRVFGRDNVEDALTFAQGRFLSQGQPVCVKPSGGHGGILVFAKCLSLQDVSDALDAVLSRYKLAIVEENVSGEDLRFFYVRPHVIGVLRSLRPAVTGDGRKTVLELLADFNATIRPTGRIRDVACDSELVRYLMSQSVQLLDIPAEGKTISLSPLSNAAAGIDGGQALSDVHPSYFEAVKRGFEAIPGLRVGAMDVIVADRTQPATEENVRVLEINSSPGVLSHFLPTFAADEQPYGPAVINLLRQHGDEIEEDARVYLAAKEVENSDVELAHQIDASLAALEAMPADALAENQMDALLALLDHARNHSPFYRDHLAEVFKGGEFSPEAWLALPILTRPDIRLLGAQLHCDETPEGGEINTVSTSGSSGSPLQVRWNRMATLATRAVTQRMYRWHGMDMKAVYAGIRSYPGKAQQFPGLLRERGWNTFETEAPFYSLSVTTPIERQLDWLKMIRPAYLNTYPSLVAELASLALARGDDLKFETVLTAGEVVTEDIRALCKQAFGAKIADSYGCQEFGKIAVQCEHPDGRLHFCTSNVLAEILDEEGNHVLPGGTGRIVLTSLYNYAMPFVRYEIGDYVTLSADPCPCGRSGPTIEKVHGRRRNMLSLPGGDRRWVSGTTLSRLSRLLGARNLRLVQTALDVLEVHYEPSGLVRDGMEMQVSQVLQETIHPDLTARVVAVAQLERSSSGKFEDVVGLLGNG